MFLNCLLLDLTVIYLMYIVHMVKIWVEIAKKYEMRTSGGRGVFSDCGHPRTRGGGGVKKGKIFVDVPYGWSLSLCHYFNRDVYNKCLSRSWLLLYIVKKDSLSKALSYLLACTKQSQCQHSILIVRFGYLTHIFSGAMEEGPWLE